MLKRKKPLQAKKGLKNKQGIKKKSPSKRAKDIEKRKNLDHYFDVCKFVDIRDRGKCQHPGCNKRGNEHHHIIYRSQNGADEIYNVVLLCWGHHRAYRESPHQSRYWRRYWEHWAKAKYPEQWVHRRLEPLETYAEKSEINPNCFDCAKFNLSCDTCRAHSKFERVIGG